MSIVKITAVTVFSTTLKFVRLYVSVTAILQNITNPDFLF